MAHTNVKRKKRKNVSSKDYIDNKEFTGKIIQWRKAYEASKDRHSGDTSSFSYPVTDDIAEDFYKIARNLAKNGKFSGYLYKEDMIQLGLYYMCKYAHNFKVDGDNAFSYFSQICYNGFLQTIKKEYSYSEKKRLLKDSFQEDLLNNPDCPMDKVKISKIKNF